MNPWEQVVLDRLEKEGNPLGWKPKGRDQYGNGFLEATLPAGDGKIKVARMTLTPQGIVCQKSRVVDIHG